jgi:hypothetical protein
MQTKRRDLFTTVRTEGALLPADLLQRVADGHGQLEGLTPTSYRLAEGERLNEFINRSWNRLLGCWSRFQASLSKLTPEDPATKDTRDRWLVPLFDELRHQLRKQSSPIMLGEEGQHHYPVSHFSGQVPVHLVGWGVELDRRTPGVPDADRRSPHSWLQELLNRSEAHLWAFLSNGRRLRLLRDNASLTRQAFVEFDLEAMFKGEVYSDFVLLWLLCHQSRTEGETSAEFWLERWSREAHERGTRALDQLRDGVRSAIEVLGRGFLAHPANSRLRADLREGRLAADNARTRQGGYFQQLLRLVYRLLFLFVAEDRTQRTAANEERGLLFSPVADPAAVGRYRRFYSTDRLRRLAERQRGTPHTDLYHGLCLVTDRLAERGCPELGLPALGSFLWSPEAVPALAGCRLSNEALLDAVRALAFTEDQRVRRPVDYRNLGSEELGSVYESLLELRPTVDLDRASFSLAVTSGNERKTTGSYYTPPSLIKSLLDSALEPVLDEACAKPKPADALLALKVCDPACGSGHFLIAAAHRIARRLAAVRSGEDEPTPEAVRSALREVIGRCVYGVDVNPMAVELCKVALWLEALDPGKPLSFLDHHVQRGNSLLGATPVVLRDGIPDEAFEPIEGDDKAVCRSAKSKNKDERRGQGSLFEERWPWERLGDLAAALAGLEQVADDSIEGIRTRQQRYHDLVESSGYRYGRLLADAWCAAFVWRKRRDDRLPYPVTEAVFRRIERNPHDLAPWMVEEIRRLAEQYNFFHWHLAYPDVFRVPTRGEGPDNELMGWCGGFDVMLGNPPWERIKLQEQEWFAARRPDIAQARNAAERRRRISALEREDPPLYQAFLDDRRKAEGESHLVRNSSGIDDQDGRRWGRYPLCGRGDVNTYTLFTETNRNLITPEGRVGCIVPIGIATDHTTQHFFRDLMETGSLVSLFGFENEEFIFPGIDHRVTFSLLTLSGLARPQPAASFAFFARRPEHLADENRRFSLSLDDLRLLNPNTLTCPVFRSRRDTDLNKAIYRRVPVLLRERPPEVNPWGVRFATMFHMANDSSSFRTRDQLEAGGWRLEGNIFRRGEEEYLPLYEAKMLHHFDHRFSTYEGQTEAQANQGKLPELDDTQHADPTRVVQPRYWVPGVEVAERLRERWARRWLLGWRDICRNTDQRTVIASLLPLVGVGHKFPLALLGPEPVKALCLYGNLCSFVLDYVARQKVGGTSLTYFYLKQFAVLSPADLDRPAPWALQSSCVDWLFSRVLELSYTAWDLEPFARECGYDGPPFRWDADRRFLLRCELDAAFFHLYGVSRDDAAYILDTFPVVRDRENKEYGEFRSKRAILEVYDSLAEAAQRNQPYSTRLDPPPASPLIDNLPPLPRTKPSHSEARKDS